MEPEVVSGNAAEQLVAQGSTLMRIENEVMLSVAVQRPRDEAIVIKRALQELALAPECAKAAYYSIPYKERQVDGSYKVVKVEGPSIKAAMSLARRWGNCTVASRLMNEDESGWDLEGVFVDFETNFRVSRPFRVSKVAKKRGGGTYRLDPQRELMALQAGASKAIRNATLAGLPDYLVSAYNNRAREIVGGKLDQKAPPETVAAVIRAFVKFNATQEQLEAYTKLKVELWTGTEVADLRGLWNAIQDGQITAEEAFAVADPDPIAKPVRASEVKPEVKAEESANDGGGAEEGGDQTIDAALRVAKVDVHSGNTKGKAWTRYDVTFSDDRVASTFGHTIGQKAQAAMAAKAPVVIELLPDGRDGLKIETLEIIEDAPDGGSTAPQSDSAQGALIPELPKDGDAA